MTEDRIIEIRDGLLPSQGESFDCVAFARSIEAKAIKQEREAILAAIEDLDERPWYGYENPNTFDDGKRDAMAVVRARSAVADTPVER